MDEDRCGEQLILFVVPVAIIGMLGALVWMFGWVATVGLTAAAAVVAGAYLTRSP